MLQGALTQIGIVYGLWKNHGIAAQMDAIRPHFGHANIEIDHLRLSKDDRQLGSVAYLRLAGDQPDLLRRRFHFTEAQLDGVQIPLKTVDAAEFVPDQLWSKIHHTLSKTGTPLDEIDLSVFLSQKPEAAVQEIIKHFESKKIADKLTTEWPVLAQEWKKSAESLQNRLKAAKTQFDQTKSPEEKVKIVTAFLATLKEVDREMQNIADSVAGLRKKAQTDYQELVTATKQDVEKIASFKNPALDTSSLSQAIIGDGIQKQWKESLTWLNWTQAIFFPTNDGLDEPGVGASAIYEVLGIVPPPKIKGEQIVFAKLPVKPEIWFDAVSLNGEVRFNDLPLYFNGAVKNFAYPPSFGDAPITAQFCFSGSGVPNSPAMPDPDGIAAAPIPTLVDSMTFPNLYVAIEVDHLDGKEQEQLVFRCPMYQLSERIWGNPDKLAIRISPGMTSLDGYIVRHKGGALSGRMIIVQKNVQITPFLPKTAAAASLDRVLTQTFAGLNEFIAEIHVAGTQTAPTYQFQSNIGEKIAPHIEQIVKTEWEAVKQQALATLSNDSNEAVAVLNKTLQEQVDPILREIQTNRLSLESTDLQNLLPSDRKIRDGIESLLKRL